MLQKISRTARNMAKAVIRRPRGFDLYHDLNGILPDPRVVFDVGANLGQSTKRYLAEFPTADIYSFEPVASTFKQLVKNVGKNRKRFFPKNVALGASISVARMNTVDGPSDMFQIIAEGNEEVAVATIDSCGDEFERIDFIKIDTEGHDMEVLKGAEHLLRQKRIGALQVEAGMNPLNDRHVPFEAFKSFLEERDYFLFGVYDQVEEFFTGEPHLRRTNPVFVPKR